jgi:hypothetical protein
VGVHMPIQGLELGGWQGTLSGLPTSSIKSCTSACPQAKATAAALVQGPASGLKAASRVNFAESSGGGGGGDMAAAMAQMAALAGGGGGDMAAAMAQMAALAGGGGEGLSQMTQLLASAGGAGSGGDDAVRAAMQASDAAAEGRMQRKLYTTTSCAVCGKAPGDSAACKLSKCGRCGVPRYCRWLAVRTCRPLFVRIPCLCQPLSRSRSRSRSSPLPPMQQGVPDVALVGWSQGRVQDDGGDRCAGRRWRGKRRHLAELPQ